MSNSESLSTKLGLGTVQFGMAYGVANKSGRVSGNQLERIMALARRREIRVFDTAPGYEQSETVLGQVLIDYDGAQVVTKTPHFHSSKISELDVELLRTTFDQSLMRLRVDSVYGLLFHRGADLLKPNSNLLWAEVENLKARNKVMRVGVSVYSPEELSSLLSNFAIDLVQLPMNILDQRFEKSGQLEQLCDAGIDVHVRSTFLQGVLVTDPLQLPEYFDALRPRLQSLAKQAAEWDVSMLAMALNYVLRVDQVGTVLVGVDSELQLLEILNAVEASIATDVDWERWAADESRWVNPSEWKLG